MGNFVLGGPDLISRALKETRNSDSNLLLALEDNPQTSNEVTALDDTLISA